MEEEKRKKRCKIRTKSIDVINIDLASFLVCDVMRSTMLEGTFRLFPMILFIGEKWINGISSKFD